MIETARLLLRPPSANDLDWVLENMNTAAVMRHLGGVRLADTVAERFASDIADFAETGSGRWILWLRVEERRIGRCGLFRMSSEAAPEALRGQHEIGWTLAEPYWGQGYASEAARAVLDFGFEALGYPVIYAQTSASNAGSTRLMERLGLERRPDLDYVDPDYPAADNPTTVYCAWPGA
ncbi:GNAT family N-acetyltransferase [Novosphingobium sp. Gsoil 351]|uniref:GNAT family N-acetyltransferase n=1 Tax=Novosphingobium sp. Gsoil 351 TaxID=2675225 RepID=UPI0012B4FACE|nr:GNAT family N-acetyltransferase [Novosphingobium sp. Gsoil 351]QGN54912.1 GNAT family N-acetyltransferase [Novosphingobium sp. Gsoil 351]